MDFWRVLARGACELLLHGPSGTGHQHKGSVMLHQKRPAPPRGKPAGKPQGHLWRKKKKKKKGKTTFKEKNVNESNRASLSHLEAKQQLISPVSKWMIHFTIFSITDISAA